MSVKFLTHSLMCLLIQALSSAEFIATCDKKCHEMNITKILTVIKPNENSLCCDAGKPIKISSCNKPPPSPIHLRAAYFILENRVFGINITWVDIAKNALFEVNGYFISIIRDRSLKSSEIFIKLAQTSRNFSFQPNEKIYFHYTFLPIDDVAIDPCYLYFISMQALPLCFNQDSQPEDISFTISDNINCEPPASPTVDVKISLTTHVPIVHPGSSYLTLVLLLVLAAILLVCLLLMFFYLVSRKKKLYDAQLNNLFVVTSSWDAHFQTCTSNLANHMCCFFKKKGLNVTFSMWHTTLLSQSNAMQWVTEQIEKADKVIVIISPKAVQLQSQNQPEEEPFLNFAHDPYTIVKRMIETADVSNKYLFVAFDHDVAIPATLSHVHDRYYLPKDSSRICNKLFSENSAFIGKELKKYIKEINGSCS